jgi:ParB family chromosome partitioning protein
MPVSSTRLISEIKIGARHRRDLGDIEGLAASIADIGLLHPVVITPDGALIAGERRLEACKRLRRDSVPVRVVDIEAIVRGELAENAHRKDFTPSELVAIAGTVEARERELAKQRQAHGGPRSGKLPERSKGDTRDRIAAPLGVSGRTLEKAKAVVEAAEAEPERFGHLIEKMDRAGKVTGAFGKLSTRSASRVSRRSPVNSARSSSIPRGTTARSRSPGAAAGHIPTRP